MATNPHFNNFNDPDEQEFLEDLIIETIQIYGIDMYYLPRQRNSFDKILYEDDTSSFEKAYMIEAYVNDSMGFRGEGTFSSKFGIEIRDQIQFSIARRRFKEEIAARETEIPRPREGDLLFFPLNKKCFEIKYVTDKPFFYQLGDLQIYQMDCELYEYSHEKFNTGITDIDNLQYNRSENLLDHGINAETGETLTTEEGDFIIDEKLQDIIDSLDPAADNKEIKDAIDTEDIMVWSEDDPFSEGTKY